MLEELQFEDQFLIKFRFKKETMTKIISIQKHCYRLKELLVCYGHSKFIIPSDWLLLASAVQTVEINIDKYDSSWFKCNAAYEYDEANQDLLKKFTRELSIFNFIWCSIEAIIDAINPPKHPIKNRRGKTRNIAYYLNKNLDQASIIEDYIKNINQFKTLASDYLDQAKLVNKLKLSSEGIAGLGLILVSELRNTFAHGSLSLPIPDENNEPYSLQLDLIKAASRICLYSLQFILYIHLKGYDDFEIYHDNSLIEHLTPSEYTYLLHLEFEPDNLSLTLFEN